MAQAHTEEMGRVLVHLEASMEHTEDREARYHIREAVQILHERGLTRRSGPGRVGCIDTDLSRSKPTSEPTRTRIPRGRKR